MKKRLMMLLPFVVLLFTLGANAQPQQNPSLPIDKNVVMGTLENGMRYYIYKNQKPAGLADFYIVHNVGAIQEEDHQNGLAHFLEHMAFNGTTNLPGKMLLDYFQANGVEFGRDINAMTGMDMTAYMLKNVPMTRAGVLDTALMTIADWSGGVALEHEEIDAERGVILEEKRTINTPQRRIQEQFLREFYNGSAYVHRNVIGTEEVLKNFKYQDIKDFYKKWYRPHLQAVVVVGDIDVAQVEAKIKERMGAIPAQENRVEREVIVIEPITEDKAIVISEPENTNTYAIIGSIVPAVDDHTNSTSYFVANSIVTSIISSVMSERFDELSTKADAPILGASFNKSGFTPHNDLIMLYVAAANNKLDKGIEAASKELKRLYQYGITPDEMERAVLNLKKSVQEKYDNRADRKTEEIAQVIQANITDNAPILDSETEYQIYNMILSQINYQQVNQMIKMFFPQANYTVAAIVPGAEGAVIPTSEAMLAAFTAGKNATVEAPKVVTIDRPLIEKEPKSGKIKKVSKDIQGNTVWTLKNGATVVIQPTELRSDEILFNATGKGGSNMISDEMFINSELLEMFMSMSGLGSFTANELPKVLAGKNVSARKNFDEYTHGIGGSSVKADIETLFKLIYLSYTAQPFLEKDYDLMMTQLNTMLANVENTPEYQFSKERNKLMYGENLRTRSINAEMLKEVSLEGIKGVHDMLFDGVKGMTFVFTGTVDEATLRPLVEKYIASLPKGGKKHQEATSKKIAKGKIYEKVAIKQESPKTTYTALLHTDNIEELTVKGQVTAQFLSAILDIMYTKSIREEMGATYGVGARVSAQRYPSTRYNISVMFDTDESKLVEAGPQVVKEIEAIANGADISSEIEIARGAMAKNYDKAVASSNRFWLNMTMANHLYGGNNMTEYHEAVKTITVEDIAALAKEILKANNVIEIIMVPAK